jgi:hypothetical protein
MLGPMGSWIMIGFVVLAQGLHQRDRVGLGYLGSAAATRMTGLGMQVLVAWVQDDPPKTGTKPNAADRESLRRTVESLAEQLDADKTDERDEAEQKLLEIGLDALGYLPPVPEDASSEWLIRIERIRETLMSKNQLEFGQPSRVTMAGEMTGREALIQLASRSGNPVPLPQLPELEKQISVAFDETPYWVAFDELLDQLELSIEPEDGGALQLVSRSPDVPQRSARATYSGGFRLEPIAISKSSDFYQTPIHTATITMSLAWESRWVPVAALFQIKDLEVVCDNGERLNPTSEQPLEFLPGGSQMVLSVDITKPSRAAKEIATWKGTMEVSIPGKSVAMEFAELDQSANKTISVGDLSVMLVKARKNRDLHEILVEVSIENQVDSETPWGWIALTEAVLIDSVGKRIEHAGWSTTHVNARNIGLSYLFELEKDLSEYRLVYRSPQSIERKTIPYLLENIPLP